MLNRRFLRIKAMQAVYVFYQTGNDNLPVAEKNMLKSIDKFYELYITQLSALLEIVEEADRQTEEGKQKYLPTKEDLNPNMRFANNRFAEQLRKNLDYRIWADKLKINWVDQRNIFKQLFNKIKKTQAYHAYMNDERDNYEKDKQYLISVLKNEFCDDENLFSYFEESSIFWADDFYNSVGLLLSFLKTINEEDNENKSIPTLFENDKGGNPEDDLVFLKKLFCNTILKEEYLEQQIQKSLKNWEYERVAFLDIILLKMAITELIEFPSIPVKVTLNEYIEIAKDFSTEKSNVFINGILENVVANLTTDGKISKKGRGLIE